METVLRVAGGGLVVLGCGHVAAVAGLVLERRGYVWRWWAGLLAAGAGFVAGAGLAVRVLAAPAGWVVPWVGGGLAVVAGYGWRRRRVLTASGAAVWSSFLALGAVGLVWSAGFLAGLPVSVTTQGLLWATVVLALVGLPSAVVTQREALEVVLRRRWSHQNEPLGGGIGRGGGRWSRSRFRAMPSHPSW